MSDLFNSTSAVLSLCGVYRQRLDRVVAMTGLVFAYFGVNPSTADWRVDDQTSKKWIGFTIRNGGCRYIAGNPFDLRATDVRELGRHPAPISADNARHLAEIIAEADILVPCWGDRGKVPKHLRHHLDALREQLFAAGKPIRVFGLTKSGDPIHPQMLAYATPLVEWPRPAARAA